MTNRTATSAAFTLRPAREADVVDLMAMIRELAAFEELSHELEVTDNSLRAGLFGEAPVARAVIAWKDNAEVAGYALFYRTFSTFAGKPGIFLDDLYVRPAFRRCGIGRALFLRVAQAGIELGGGRLEWITLRWNEQAFRFYRRIGASVMNDWALLRMNGNEVRNLANTKVKVTA